MWKILGKSIWAVLKLVIILLVLMYSFNEFKAGTMMLHDIQNSFGEF